MSSPFITEVLREALGFLEGEFPLLSDPPETTREAAVAVICYRLSYALQLQDPTELDDPFGPEEEPDGLVDWEDERDDEWEPEGEEYRPYGWQPWSWGEPDRPDLPDADASGRCFSDAAPGL